MPVQRDATPIKHGCFIAAAEHTRSIEGCPTAETQCLREFHPVPFNLAENEPQGKVWCFSGKKPITVCGVWPWSAVALYKRPLALRGATQAMFYEQEHRVDCAVTPAPTLAQGSFGQRRNQMPFCAM